MDTILVVNSGSSSVKFQVFEIGSARDPQRRLRGQVDGIGIRPRLRVTDPSGIPIVDQTLSREEVPDVPTALHAAGTWLRQKQDIAPAAFGHRVVHGGAEYYRPMLVDASVLSTLERYVPLAPLHQPYNLRAIYSLRQRFPNLPQIACFDTAFHRGHCALADSYAIPQSFYDEGVRRYGFHGLSYEYIAGRLEEIAPDVAARRVIVAHLGSGASMCALAGGRSVECTMGFTALDGLPMGTRPGQLDPGVVLYLIAERGMSASAVQDLLYHDCGLKGLSGISNDMRELESSSDPRAAFAVDYFSYRAGLSAGMLAAALGGLDAVVFTAGIGENSATVRARICEMIGWLGVELDPVRNGSHAVVISRPESRIPVYVIHTDEELMIARHTLALLAAGEHRPV